MAVGKRIYLKRDLPDPELVAAFREVPASNVADCMERICAMHPRIRLISSPKAPVATGPAYTVKCRGGDNLALHAALTFCQAGDMIVVANDEETTRSLAGEVMMTYLKEVKHVAGIIVDGPLRDMDALSTWDFPIYCTGSTPGGPYKNGPGELNVPIACGGVTVNPGDIIVADADGAIVVPRKDAPAILKAAIAYRDKDRAKVQEALEGRANRAWVDKALADLGFEIIDDVYRP